MSNYLSGHNAEKRAAKFLASKGFKVRKLNWKTRWCEIDIVSEKENTIYFVEVKYRRNANQGSGIDYITHKKLKQMGFAAQMWVSENDWQGDYVLAGLGIDKNSFEFIVVD